jgi:hypothetical protein
MNPWSVSSPMVAPLGAQQPAVMAMPDIAGGPLCPTCPRKREERTT